MPAAGFEHAMPAIVRLYAYALDCTSTRIGHCKIISSKKVSKRITHFIIQYIARRNAFQKVKTSQFTDLIIFPNYETLKTIFFFHGIRHLGVGEKGRPREK
jgi:hypothetical protein